MTDDNDPADSWKKKDGDTGRKHEAIVAALHSYILSEGLVFDAHGNLRAKGSWLLSDRSIPDIAADFAFRERFNYPLVTSYAIETLESISRIKRVERRDALKALLLEKEATEAGRAELRKWLRAVTGRDDPTDFAVLRHWLWLVKRGLADLKPEHHVMPILEGKQGGGKSMALAKLLEPLGELAMIPASAAILTDERRTPVLAAYAVAVLDEMQGVQKADIEALKQTLTAEAKSYRPMRTTESHQVPVRCRFIGSTNESVGGIINDTTGARRFYALRCPERLDWRCMDGVSPALIWQAVSEREPCGLPDHLGEVSNRQAELKRKDSVTFWLETETWTFPGYLLNGTIDGGGKEPISIKSGDWLPTRVIRVLYLLWCRRTKEAEMPAAWWGRRLQAEGFVPSRRVGDPTVPGKQQPGYTVPNVTEG